MSWFNFLTYASCLVVCFFLLIRCCAYVARCSRLRVVRRILHRRDGESQAKNAPSKGDANCTRLLLPRSIKVALLHIDLSFGGAERLVLDAALGLKNRQTVAPISVTIITSFLDPVNSFPETLDGSVEVIVFGAWIPHTIFGRARALCSMVRMAYMTVMTCWSMPDTDCFVVDQVATGMAVLKLLAPYTPILFYCHFPDKMCDGNRTLEGKYKDNSKVTTGHRSYRRVFDLLEEWGMNFATRVVYNSQYTKDCVLSTFPSLSASSLPAAKDVVYPCVDFRDDATLPKKSLDGDAPTGFDAGVSSDSACTLVIQDGSSISLDDKILFVSINRYEREKSIELAIEAFSLLRQRLQKTYNAENEADGHSKMNGNGHGDRGHTVVDPDKLLLVIAGGCNVKLQERIAYYHELDHLAYDTLSLPRQSVIFMRNITNDVKTTLLRSMRALVYTAANEHFGIVPLEAMHYGRPVVAVAYGGPCETVGLPDKITHLDDSDGGDVLSNSAQARSSNTDNHVKLGDRAGGILCEPNAEAFADAMEKFALDGEFADQVGVLGKIRVRHGFTMERFATVLANHIVQLYCNEV